MLMKEVLGEGGKESEWVELVSMLPYLVIVFEGLSLRLPLERRHFGRT